MVQSCGASFPVQQQGPIHEPADDGLCPVRHPSCCLAGLPMHPFCLHTLAMWPLASPKRCCHCHASCTDDAYLVTLALDVGPVELPKNDLQALHGGGLALSFRFYGMDFRVLTPFDLSRSSQRPFRCWRPIPSRGSCVWAFRWLPETLWCCCTAAVASFCASAASLWRTTLALRQG